MGRLKAKSHLAAVPWSVHGGPDRAELQGLAIRPEDILDFSVNANPAPVPEELRQLLACADVSTYPDDDSQAVRQAAADAYGLPAECVLAGNGSSELIWLAALAYIPAAAVVLVRQPTFGEYERAARIQGAEVATYDGELSAALLRHDPAAVFVCNPNNPTGDETQPELLLDLARAHPATFFVVDEAYADFVHGRPSAIGPHMPDNLLVLRSLTKFSALAGLRLGLGLARPEVIEALRRVKPPWNVNAPAQIAGEYALRHPDMLPDVEGLAMARDELMHGLRTLGLLPRATDCNFFLVQAGDAASLRSRLLSRGCLVRDCASFGLPDHIRIAVRSRTDNDRLLGALREVL